MLLVSLNNHINFECIHLATGDKFLKANVRLIATATAVNDMWGPCRALDSSVSRISELRAGWKKLDFWIPKIRRNRPK